MQKVLPLAHEADARLGQQVERYETAKMGVTIADRVSII